MIKFKEGGRYAHKNFLDVHIQVIKATHLLNDSVKLKVNWFTDTLHLAIDEITIKKQDRVNWYDITV